MQTNGRLLRCVPMAAHANPHATDGATRPGPQPAAASALVLPTAQEWTAIYAMLRSRFLPATKFPARARRTTTPLAPKQGAQNARLHASAVQACLFDSPGPSPSRDRVSKMVQTPVGFPSAPVTAAFGYENVHGSASAHRVRFDDAGGSRSGSAYAATEDHEESDATEDHEAYDSASTATSVATPLPPAGMGRKRPAVACATGPAAKRAAAEAPRKRDRATAPLPPQVADRLVHRPTIAENGQPKTSRFSCVAWNRNAYKWQAYLRIKKKRIHLGYYVDEEEAGMAVAQARKNLAAGRDIKHNIVQNRK